MATKLEPCPKKGVERRGEGSTLVTVPPLLLLLFVFESSPKAATSQGSERTGSDEAFPSPLAQFSTIVNCGEGAEHGGGE